MTELRERHRRALVEALEQAGFQPSDQWYANTSALVDAILATSAYEGLLDEMEGLAGVLEAVRRYLPTAILGQPNALGMTANEAQAFADEFAGRIAALRAQPTDEPVDGVFR